MIVHRMGLVHLALGLLQHRQSLLQASLSLTYTLEGAADMGDELVKDLIGITVSITLQLGGIGLGALHDLPGLGLSLLHKGAGLSWLSVTVASA